VTLAEVTPSGTVTNLTSGAVLGSLSSNDPARSWTDTNGVPTRPYGKFTADTYLPAGSIQKYDFLISPRFAAITPGNKLRLTITTQTPAAGCSRKALAEFDPVAEMITALVPCNDDPMRERAPLKRRCGKRARVEPGG
jgi:hypothetical protein